MLNFSMFIKGVNVRSEILEEVVAHLPKATYVSVFSRDASELNAELIDSLLSFGFVTDGVIGVAKSKTTAAPKVPSSYINFKRLPITGAALERARKG